MDDHGLWADGAARLPALTGEDRAAAVDALAAYDQAPRGTGPRKIAALVGAAAVAFPAQRVSDDEAAARIDLYQRQLADIDADILADAFSAAINANRFFPTIAEIREHAAKLPAPLRVVRAWRLRQILRAAPEPEAADPFDVDAANAEMEAMGSRIRFKPDGGTYRLPAAEPDQSREAA
ncbi:hypothetical protein PQ455_01540 [Sphingomonas naphthae]|uniref:Uncharacterized protein n=1 Tax=Sphingomonas naphthae TaxID=1813468 RepID=A0ABY7TLS2_9SPHN|nr:hypothetical protein [Sphingomonas naphthae]WCT73943.1 hypothetical protein PQ455_01540 [Sphingomonas naphthae]